MGTEQCLSPSAWNDIAEFMKQLFLVRHGESEWNQLGRIQGQTDTPLTGLGIEQAQKIARFMAKNLDSTRVRIHVSPMQRAIQTAEIIAETINHAVADLFVDERLNDFNLGEITGSYGWDQVAISYPELAYLRLNQPLNFHPPGGESGTDFYNRLNDFLQQPADEGLIHLVVSHGIVNKFIRSIRLDLHGADIIALGESQESIFELNDDREAEHELED